MISFLIINLIDIECIEPSERTQKVIHPRHFRAEAPDFWRLFTRQVGYINNYRNKKGVCGSYLPRRNLLPLGYSQPFLWASIIVYQFRECTQWIIFSHVFVSLTLLAGSWSNTIIPIPWLYPSKTWPIGVFTDTYPSDIVISATSVCCAFVFDYYKMLGCDSSPDLQLNNHAFCRQTGWAILRLRCIEASLAYP